MLSEACAEATVEVIKAVCTLAYSSVMLSKKLGPKHDEISNKTGGTLVVQHSPV